MIQILFYGFDFVHFLLQLCCFILESIDIFGIFGIFGFQKLCTLFQLTAFPFGFQKLLLRGMQICFCFLICTNGADRTADQKNRRCADRHSMTDAEVERFLLTLMRNMKCQEMLMGFLRLLLIFVLNFILIFIHSEISHLSFHDIHRIL